MLVIFLTFLAGAGVGYAICKVVSRRRQRELENDLLRCQSIINNLTVASSCDENPMWDVYGNNKTLEIDDGAVMKMAGESDADNELLQKVRNITEAHISDENFGVDQLCKELSISRMQLNRKLKKLVSMSPNQLILDIRMKYAASLLTESKLNVGEVAYRLGFSSHSYFSSKFKEYFGVSPSDYVAGNDSSQKQ